MDHRQGARSQALSLVKVICGNKVSYSGIIYNISYHGLFVVSNANVSPDDNVTIVVDMPYGNSSNAIQIQGMVIHKKKHGFGIMFSHNDLVARRFVTQLIKSNSTTWDKNNASTT